VAASLNNIAMLDKLLGNDTEAEPLFQRAIGILKDTFGEEHPNTARVMLNLGAMYSDQGKFELAEPLLEKSLQTMQTLSPHNYEWLSQALNAYASLLAKTNRRAQAEVLQTRAMVYTAIFREARTKK
jgi:tetratricopeptide (TPR) repeat protein